MAGSWGQDANATEALCKSQRFSATKLEFGRLKVPNSRFALHGLAHPKIHGLCLFLTRTHGVCAFSGPSSHLSRQPLLCQPLSSRLALHSIRALWSSNRIMILMYPTPFVLYPHKKPYCTPCALFQGGVSQAKRTSETYRAIPLYRSYNSHTNRNLAPHSARGIVKIRGFTRGVCKNH